MSGLHPYQREFIDFLVRSSALLFGAFKTKSGRETPYFINTGKFDSGEKITTLGSFYAKHLVQTIPESVSVIFGPAYKGIGLAIACASALHRDHGRDIRFAFDRKEAKGHGDKGKIVGSIAAGDKTIIVEDVITAGTTLKEIVPLLRTECKAEVAGVIIAVDRRERGSGELSAIDETSRELGIRIFPIVTVLDIIAYLSADNTSGKKLSKEEIQKMNDYLELYAPKN